VADLEPPDLQVVPPENVRENERSQEGSPDGDDIFTTRELAFIGARAAGTTIKASAEAANPPYTYITARRLDDREDVRSMVRKLARESVDCGVRTLAQSATAAANALTSVAERGGTGDGPRVSAARAVLELSIQSLKVDDILERVEALESRQEQRPGNVGRRRF
jgi:hypothetical protein